MKKLNQNNNVTIGILIPSYNRSNDIIYRCFQSVKWQILPIDVQLKVLVCHDGPNETELKNICNEYGFSYFESLPTHDYANAQRQFLLEEAHKLNTDYILFLDDDNIIYPDYIKSCLEEIKDNDFTLCKIIHFGPLPQRFGPPPVILNGNPPILQNVDTLQLFVKTNIMLENGWNQDGGYLADGMTIESLGKKYKYTFINKILGIHC